VVGSTRVPALIHGGLRLPFDPCALLRGNARTACEFARGLVPGDPPGGGGGGGGGGGFPCSIGFAIDPRTGRCAPISQLTNGHDDLIDVDPLFLSPGEASISVGEAVMGRYGAGMVPGNQVINRADCNLGGRIRGMVLGDDGVCYNRREISNKQRMWPRGRRPLLTGGDLNAISKAKRAAGRLARVISDTRSIGLLKPAPKRRKK